MGTSDWAALAGGLGSNIVAAGVTAGEPVPPGGGTYTFGMRSLVATSGAVGLYVDKSGFDPVPGFDPGAPSSPTNRHVSQSIRGCLERAASPGAAGVSAALFVCLETAAVGARGYLLGLSDGDPSFIVLRKGVLADGLTNAPVGWAGIIRRSEEPVAVGEWVHLRLDAVINTTNDVVLNVFRNDLTLNTVAAPVWEAVPGISGFVDDALGANSGSLPLTAGGFIGFAAKFGGAGQRVHFDRIEPSRGV